jgi:hypothetical protein
MVGIPYNVCHGLAKLSNIARYEVLLVVAVKNVYCLLARNVVDIYRCFRETCLLHLSEAHDEIIATDLIPHVSDVIGSGRPHLLTSTVVNRSL